MESLFLSFHPTAPPVSRHSDGNHIGTGDRRNMPRVKRSVAGRKKRKKILKLAKGFFGARRRQYRLATESVNRAMAFAYRDRKARKREFRRLWIARINAAARLNSITYSRLIAGLERAGVILDRKVLADIAVSEPRGFSHVAQVAAGGLEK